MQNLTRSLGFNSLQQAEESQSIAVALPPTKPSSSNDPKTSANAATHSGPDILVSETDVEPYLKRITELEEDNARLQEESSTYAARSESLQSRLDQMAAESTTLTHSLEVSQARVANLEKTNRKLKEDFEGRLDLAVGLVESLNKTSPGAAAVKDATRLGPPSPAPTSRTATKENQNLVTTPYVLLHALYFGGEIVSVFFTIRCS